MDREREREVKPREQQQRDQPQRTSTSVVCGRPGGPNTVGGILIRAPQTVARMSAGENCSPDTRTAHPLSFLLRLLNWSMSKEQRNVCMNVEFSKHL